MDDDDPIPLHVDMRFKTASAFRAVNLLPAGLPDGQAPQGYDYKRHEDWVRLMFQPVEDHKTWQKRLYKACEALASS